MRERETGSPTSADGAARLPRAAHVLCYALLAGVCLWALAARWSRPVVLGGPIPVKGRLVGRVERRIDPNTAPWPELACLPGIGEVLARRIVAYREAGGGGQERGGRTAVFSRVEDLGAVPGIGAKKLRGLAEGLRFPRPAPGGAVDTSGGGGL